MSIWKCRICGNRKYKTVMISNDSSILFNKCTCCGVLFSNPDKFCLPTINFKKLDPSAKMPEKVHGHDDTGYDLFTIDCGDILPGETKLFKTGLAIEYPKYMGSQIRCRSGMGKKGIMLSNGIGTIDSCYRGDHGILLFNSTSSIYHVEKYDRIAQLVFEITLPYEIKEVDEINDTVRSDKSYGSSGK